jgi:branched-chain amino acid transport system permease protein
MAWVTDLLQYTISGLTVGAIYALVAIGYNIIYNVTEIINFAQGEFVVLGGLFAVLFVGSLHLPIAVASFSVTDQTT